MTEKDKDKINELIKRVDDLLLQSKETSKRIDNLYEKELRKINRAELVRCSLCDKKISNKATFCPQCGNPMLDTEIVIEKFFDTFFVALSNYDENTKEDMKVVFFSPDYVSMNAFGVSIRIEVIAEMGGRFFFEAEYGGVHYVEEKLESNVHMQLRLDIDKNLDEYFEPQCIDFRVGYLYGENIKEVLFSGYVVFDWDDEGEIYIESEEVRTELKQMSQSKFEEFWGEEYWVCALNDDDQDDDNDYDGYKTDDNLETSDWNEESYLRKRGYTVSQIEELNDDERQ